MILLALAAATATPPPPRASLAIGIGITSCAVALAPDTQRDSIFWILGFWSGLNTAVHATVGSNSDPKSIVAAVASRCDRRPSMQLMEAVIETYNEMGMARPK